MNRFLSLKTSENSSSIEAKRNFIARVTIALCFFLCVGFASVFFIQSIYPLNILFLFFAGIYVVAWTMAVMNNALAAKVVLYSSMLAQVFFMSIVLGVFVQVKVFYIPIAIVPLLIFTKQEKYPMYALLILTGINIVMINTFVENNIFQTEKIYSTDTYNYINNAFDITSMLCMLILAFLFLQLTEAGEIQLVKANEALSNQKELERKSNFLLKKAKEDQERANVMKDFLFRIISHDLRSPINTIHGLTELLLSHRLTNDERILITEQLKKSTDSTNQLLDNLLSWSAFQINNSTKPVIDTIVVKDLVKDIFKQLEVKAVQKNIQLVENVGIDLSIYGDAHMVEIIIRNLLSNAIKFSFKEQRVSIHAEKIDENIILQIKDQGIGIPKEILERLFTNDKTVSREGTFNEKGTGIGLLLCKNLLENCGGTIDVNSIPNQQTIFTVKIPTNTPYKSQDTAASR